MGTAGRSVHIVASIFLGSLVVSPARAEEAPLGFEAASAAAACASLSGSERDGDAPLPVLIALAPETLRDPAPIDPLLECAASRRLTVVARLEPPSDWQRAADPYAAIGGWLSDLEGFLESRHERVRRLQLGSRPELRFDADSYVFLIEKVSTLVRSFDPGATLVAGALGEGAGSWLDRIEPRRLDPYIDGLALEDPIDLGAWLPRLARDYPGHPVWLHPGEASADPAALLRRLHAAHAAGVETFFVAARDEDPSTLLALHLARALPSRFVVDPEAPPGALGFADPLGPERALVTTNAWIEPLAVGSDPVRDIRVVDLASGAQVSAWASRAGGEGAPVTIVAAPAPAGPALVRYIVMKGPRAAPETVGVSDAYEMTAEEIIARERAFQAAQARTLDHYEARADISYHYRAETLGESIDVASVNRFFWKEGVGEYQEIELYINGARWKGKPPPLPFIQAEKVKEVPLEIRLDESYTYRLKGKDTVNGRPAYLLGFEPARTEGPLYSGEVWIDATRFARLRIRLIQHGLKEPITSSSDVIEYGEVPAEGPRTSCWLPVSGYRQMVFTVLGRAVAVERRVSYEDFSINAVAFDQGREEAYASGLPILRDDQDGYSYVIKEAGGFRTVRTESLRNVAFFGGLGINSTGSLASPFGGVNYFDFNWRNTGTQLDVAFAGLLLGLVWTNPGVGDTRWELTLDGRFVGLPENFRRTTSDGRIDEEGVKVLQQKGLVSLSHPITPFQKVSFQTEILYDRYRDGLSENLSDPLVKGDPNTRVRLPDFAAPPDGVTGLATARWNYHRSGYLFDLWYSAGHRFRWDDWGLPELDDPADPNAPTHLVGGRADDTDFGRWGLTTLKSFYPTKLQTFSLGVSFFDGTSLDRFSRFRIGDFRNARVRGFNGKDLTFDRGVTAQVNYKFTLPRGGASVEVGLERAAIENEEDLGGREYVAGGGAALSVQGPWGTLLSFRSSFGLGSSIEEVDSSGAGIRIVMIKTMDHWPGRRPRDSE